MIAYLPFEIRDKHLYRSIAPICLQIAIIFANKDWSISSQSVSILSRFKKALSVIKKYIASISFDGAIKSECKLFSPRTQLMYATHS